MNTKKCFLILTTLQQKKPIKKNFCQKEFHVFKKCLHLNKNYNVFYHTLAIFLI